MKAWIGAVTIVAALTLSGAATIDPAIAAEATAAAAATSVANGPASQRRTHRHVRHVYRPYERPRYLGRPTYYVPAPFPLGFDFGFGWW